MPGFDRTGPEGGGPMTGRRMGRCTNYGAALKDRENMDNADSEGMDGRGRGFGRGFGRGRGVGRGRGRGRGLGNQHRFRGWE